ncbi:2-hydroxychromene-2-carboxylate isomeras-like protein [Coniella lustricola]|uniref:Glutathione S-transferase kappa n=1 Tax=Coniella lustricola TaxID=2025994 RepID=A0A2T3A809_9PEZI|nr:2-hydroxychromene-2-carboxylate isomeras-like protein [Coniella lustricola]
MKITLYVDIVSPFAYVAYHILRHNPAFKACEITYIPVFLGGIMKTAGNTAPIYIHNKDKWINQERIRWASYFSVPVVPDVPKGFPHLTLHVMRAICALVQQQQQQTTAETGTSQSQTSPAAQKILISALDAFYDAYWVQGRIVSEKEVLSEVLGKILSSSSSSSSSSTTGSGNSNVEQILTLATTEGKKILQANTDQAYAEGAFGLPWMVCENNKGEKEGFWGVDHLGCVLEFLGIEKPRSGGWRAML